MQPNDNESQNRIKESCIGFAKLKDCTTENRFKDLKNNLNYHYGNKMAIYYYYEI